MVSSDINRGGRGEAVTLGTCSSSALDLSAGKTRSSGSITPVSYNFLLIGITISFFFCYTCLYTLQWAANKYEGLVLWGIMRGKNRGTVKDFRGSYTHMDTLTVAGQRRQTFDQLMDQQQVGSGSYRGWQRRWTRRQRRLWWDRLSYNARGFVPSTKKIKRMIKAQCGTRGKNNDV